jgi:Glycosyl hydrolases family 2, sugar binding domain/Glycosyl hydrolases family 2, TIM barrel domain/Glycosyl hydrolases family 2
MTRSILRCASLFGIFTSVLSASAAEIPRPEHPEPMAVRPHWSNLNGTWEFRFDADDQGRTAGWFETGATGFDRKINVPFGWESELSGIHQPKGAPRIGWYRRSFEVPQDFPAGDHVWLRFGAVDEQADVWVNGKHVAEHAGGYSPFEADVTDALKPGVANSIVVRAFDPTDPSHPTGKQVGWYTTTSGIWQTVWLESRPSRYIKDFSIVASVDPAEATFHLTASGQAAAPGDFRVTIDGAEVKALPAKSEGDRRSLSYRIAKPRLWSPDSPHLYDATIALLDGDGKAVDSLKTYFGLRTIKRAKVGDQPYESILLNGKPIYLRGALDQSFNPLGVYTAPTDAFLKRDIELAKAMGTNFLRIHIKPDEPRRLYWADKLGMMIMEDMPNSWRQNAQARATWEKTMREVVARDRNHPAIFAWVDFNETWGLGSPPDYKADRDTQGWVRDMVALTRKLDPTRLVEDNSPCNFDHVEGTDLNSWHFYIDDHEAAARHVAEVVKNSVPGASFNYCPGQKMNSAPLINSEYGSVGAGDGDRDVSGGFRDLTTLLRKYPAIQGYIYTELSDIEWEHNGFYNYDRSPKDFGYGAFVPGMTPADLQGADFVGYDGPPVIVVNEGDLIPVNLFVSHYSDRAEPPTMKWWITGRDNRGEVVEMAPRERPVEWTPHGVKEQKRIAFRLNSPFVGGVALTLVDKAGQRIAANFVNVVVRPKSPTPWVEKFGDHEVVLRFAPDSFSKSEWSVKTPIAPPGKAYGQGSGSLTYKLKVPPAVVKAKPTSFDLLLEVASKAGRGKVDWPDRVNSRDYPQTDARKWPSTLGITINGHRVGRFELPDDPADARGVLSHLAKVDHGSHGEIVTLSGDLPDEAKADLANGKPLIVRLVVAEAGESSGGLSVYGADTGAYPFDPTLVLRTEGDLPADLGVKRDEPVVADTSLSRQSWILISGDAPRATPTSWKFTTSDPGPGWSDPKFDSSTWSNGLAGFGAPETPAIAVKTAWKTPAIWLRTVAESPAIGPNDTLVLRLFHDEDCEIFVNGKPLLHARGYVSSYRDVELNESQKAIFRPGANTIAVSCKQTGGGQGIDVGLKLIKAE